jgi:hypothetical protein
MNTHDGVLGVVLPAEQFLDLGGLDVLLQLPEMRLEIFGDRLALLGPFDEGADLLLAVVEMLDEIEVVLEAAPLSGKCLALCGIGPNTGIG